VSDGAVADHYTSGELWTRLRAALIDDGVDPDAPSVETLAPYDQFHGRGLEATAEIADRLDVSPGDHLLDAGCGLGGPARYVAERFGCRVTGIDLTEEFCELARRLTSLTGLDDRVAIEHGSALAMPFADETFDGAYSLNVSMNIEDKAGLYTEIHRVMRPGAWLVLSEIARGPEPGLRYPTPWARSEESSFLVTPDETQELLESCGFDVDTRRETTAEAADYGERSRQVIEQGGRPLHRAVALIHGDDAATISANSGSAQRERQVVPLSVYARRPR
jgi:SAM-dependent methyltransferase